MGYKRQGVRRRRLVLSRAKNGTEPPAVPEVPERSDSCAACHGRPRGAAGFGGDVVTRPDSRDAPHLLASA
jgi:hypothetical protein